jgi:hypothetical protein
MASRGAQRNRRLEKEPADDEPQPATAQRKQQASAAELAKQPSPKKTKTASEAQKGKQGAKQTDKPPTDKPTKKNKPNDEPASVKRIRQNEVHALQAKAADVPSSLSASTMHY